MGADFTVFHVNCESLLYTALSLGKPSVQFANTVIQAINKFECNVTFQVLVSLCSHTHVIVYIHVHKIEHNIANCMYCGRW